MTPSLGLFNVWQPSNPLVTCAKWHACYKVFEFILFWLSFQFPKHQTPTRFWHFTFCWGSLVWQPGGLVTLEWQTPLPGPQSAWTEIEFEIDLIKHSNMDIKLLVPIDESLTYIYLSLNSHKLSLGNNVRICLYCRMGLYFYML